MPRRKSDYERVHQHLRLFTAEAIVARMRQVLDKWRADEPLFGADFNGLVVRGVMQ